MRAKSMRVCLLAAMILTTGCEERPTDPLPDAVLSDVGPTVTQLQTNQLLETSTQAASRSGSRADQCLRGSPGRLTAPRGFARYQVTLG